MLIYQRVLGKMMGLVWISCGYDWEDQKIILGQSATWLAGKSPNEMDVFMEQSSNEMLKDFPASHVWLPDWLGQCCYYSYHISFPELIERESLQENTIHFGVKTKVSCNKSHSLNTSVDDCFHEMFGRANGYHKLKGSVEKWRKQQSKLYQWL